MDLKEQIFADLISALKSKNEVVITVLKLLKNSIKNREIELGREVDSQELNKVLLSEAKKRKDSIEQFKKGNREDLVEKESQELKVIERYLPEMKSVEEIKNLICDIIKEESIEKSMDNFGTLMKLSMDKLNGSADGKIVSQIVRDQLS